MNELLAKLRHANYKSLIDITLWYSVIIETLSRAHQLDHYCLTIEDINMVCVLAIFSIVMLLCIDDV